MPPPSANSTWFNFSISGGPDFAVYAFSGWERISSPYNFTIDLVSPFASVKLIELIGREACLSIFDRSGSSRLVHGVIREMQQLHTANLRTFYRAILVPRLFFLGSRRNHKIFQHKSVPDIISEILEEQNFTSESFAFKCFHKYQPREYCVQYGESDLYFISRLCEEEGIYYYFEHSREGHRLCFSDMPGGPRINGESNLRYFSGSGQVADTAVVSRTRLRSQGVSDKTLLRDWNFITPTAILDGSASEPDFAKAPGASGLNTEIYIYPNIYQTRAEAERYAEIHLQRQLTFQTWLEAESDASRFLPGFTFSLHGHDQEGLNSDWWITSVAHRGEQPQVLEHEAPDRGQFYASTLTAIPENVRFVPENMHPKKRVPGAQTAIVTGPEGEEIYPDEYGRVKVQFFWDREGKKDEKTTCWIRPSQGWAGTGFGDMAIPRIGHEVVVTFLEGDPDRPVITGRVYHGGNMPPYDLPEHKTRTVLRSRSTPEGRGPRGFNEFRIEDKAGEEEIYVRAEKDVNIHVKNDWKKHILRDRRKQVDNYDYTHIKGETHISLKGQRKTELRSDDHLTINADSHVRIDQQWLLKAGTEIHVASGARILLEAGVELTVKAGGSWIKLDASGVSIDGKKIYISGGGKAGVGTPAMPLKPEEAIPVDTSIMPKAIVPESEKIQSEKKKTDGELRIGIFFDGSGENKDKPGANITNIGKLYDLYYDIFGKYHKIYIPGVGTRTKQRSSDSSGTHLTTSYEFDFVSLAFGEGGEGGSASHALELASKSLILILKSVDLTTVNRIIIDIFGFSRGAALARHFINALVYYGIRDPNHNFIKVSRKIPHEYQDVFPNLIVENNHNGGYYTYKKLECDLVIGFVGLFDTVGAFYAPNNFDEGNFKLLLPSVVKSCTYQIAAADEYRDYYGLYTLEKFAKQDDVPGCHSDIGGGYAISKSQEDILKNRHGVSYILLGTASINTEFDQPSITLWMDCDLSLKFLCLQLLKEFVEMEEARKKWTIFPNDRKKYYLSKQEKAGIKFMVDISGCYKNKYDVNILKLKEERIDLRYVYLKKMYTQALEFNVPFDELKLDGIQTIPEIISLANHNYSEFWERYIHLSSLGNKKYAHCYMAKANGEIVLKPNLLPNQFPHTAYPVSHIEGLIMKEAKNGIRRCCDNDGNECGYSPIRQSLNIL